MLVHYTHELPMGHRLQNHTGKCRHLHGHNYLITVHIDGEINEKTGMFIDFSILKGVVKKVLDEYDHALALEWNDPLTDVVKDYALVRVFPCPPTAEVLAMTWRQMIAEALGLDLYSVKIRVHETRDCAVYV